MFGVTLNNFATTERHMQYIWCHNNQLSLIIKSHKFSINFEFLKKKMCHILNIIFPKWENEQFYLQALHILH